jgi:hypothetical protein
LHSIAFVLQYAHKQQENKMKSLLTIKNAIIAAVIVVVIIIGYNLVKKPAAAPAPAAKPAVSAPVTPAAPAKK